MEVAVPQDIMARLNRGELLLMDGGTGSELQRRGVGVAREVQGGDIGAWSARALGEAPEVVREVHVDYLNVGADIIITNSFWSNSTRMSLDGIGEKWEEYTRLAGEIAVQARDDVNPDAYVAGGIAPPGNGHPSLFKELREQAEVLARTGVDVILPEYVGSIEDCVNAVDACSEVGLPVFLGVKHVNERLSDPEALISGLDGHKVDAILAMCSAPEYISDRLPALRAAYDGITGGYANIGYEEEAHATSDSDQQIRTISWGENTPERYAEYGREWIDMGAQIMGGCCATGPEHIEALRPVVKGQTAGA